VTVGDAGRLADLPVDAGRNVLLVMLVVVPRHARHVEDEVPDLAEEVGLIDVPLVTIAVGDVDVGVKQGDAFKVL
jgi:hypothetical protein